MHELSERTAHANLIFHHLARIHVKFERRKTVNCEFFELFPIVDWKKFSEIAGLSLQKEHMLRNAFGNRNYFSLC